MKLSQKIQSCELSPIRKFGPAADEARRRGVNIIPLNIGQPDIATPPAFFDEVRRFSARTLEYAPSGGVPEYLDAVRGYYARLGVSLSRDDILATNGGSEALQMALVCMLDEGDEILTPEPFYTNYRTFTVAAGGRVKPIPTSAEEGFGFAERERIEPLITERTRAILITNPGNPTGVVLNRDELNMIAALAREHGIFVICDEVYREFIYNGEDMTTMLEFEEYAENIVVIDSVSKRFSACGARVGALISKNRELMQNAMKLCQSRLCGVSLDQRGAAAMYACVGSEYFAAVREEYKARRDTVMAGLAEIPGVVCRRPEGAFYMMAKLPVDNAESFQRFMLESFTLDGDTVMTAPGEGFYATPGLGVDEVRLAYVREREVLARAMTVLKEGIRAYSER